LRRVARPPRAADAGADWLQPLDGGWAIAVWVQPGARSTEPAGVLDGCLKLRLSAPPVEGRANEELLRWVARRLDLPLRAVELAAGASSRRKRLRAQCALARDEVAQRLLRP
jgi:hypothetical protein